MSGYAIWGHDIGGYQDTNFSVSMPNLQMRWSQFGCFSLIMQMHRQVTKEMQYPWRYGEEALNNFIFFAKLHTRLFPYIYTYASLASSTGLPIIRPSVLLDQTDPNTFNLGHIYHFGNEFLVAPMITPNANSRQVYLPAGNWIDFWSHARHNGGQNIQWNNADQSQFPLFVREGSVIPMLLNDTDSLCEANYINNPAVKAWDRNLLFVVYPAGTSGFTVYDGTSLQCTRTGANTTLTLLSSARSIELQVLTGIPAGVTRDGATLPMSSAPPQLPAGDGWVVGPQPGFISIKF
jgi:alpha-D-xyloside xylohydrolase